MSDDVIPHDELVLWEVRDHVGLITLNRPAARNAVNGAVAQRLDALVELSEGDDDVRAVVLASSHATVFSAGADLGEIAKSNGASLSTQRGGFAGLSRASRTKPWIAAVGGAAFAGGLEMVLACDMIVASPEARFALPEVKRGLFAGAGGPLRLQRALPRGVALELIATGDALDATRAYQLGMVNRLSGNGPVLDEALALARAIAGNAPLAVRESVAIAREAGAMSEADYWRRSRETAARVFGSEDAREGPRAFLEKREPRWSGR